MVHYLPKKIKKHTGFPEDCILLLGETIRHKKSNFTDGYWTGVALRQNPYVALCYSIVFVTICVFTLTKGSNTCNLKQSTFAPFGLNRTKATDLLLLFAFKNLLFS